MLGYHDSSKCAFDLWAPASGSVENGTFSAYALHTTVLNEIANEAVENYRNGDYEMSINTRGEYLSQSDLEYIKNRIYNLI